MAYATPTEYKNFFSSAQQVKGSMPDETGIGILLESASEMIDLYTGWTFVADVSASERVYRPLTLPDGQVYARTHDYAHEPTLVRTSTDRQTWSSVDADAWRKAPSYPVVNQPYTGVFLNASTEWVEVTAQWGWAAVPSAVKLACIHVAKAFVIKQGAFGSGTGAAVQQKPTVVMDILESTLSLFRRESARAA